LFTGIIEELGKVNLVQPDRLSIKAQKVLESVSVGDSISVNGVCLTVTTYGTDFFTVDTMPETVRRTTFASLKVNDEINLERALQMGGRLGGHLVQGHVDDTGKIISIRPEGDAAMVRIEAPRDILRYVVTKGFIAIDGISLTVVEKSNGWFSISLIPITRRSTTFHKRRVGDMVNLEIDIIAKYVEALANGRTNGITADYLQEHGFLVK
jgi:riboflavin synthase